MKELTKLYKLHAEFLPFYLPLNKIAVSLSDSLPETFSSVQPQYIYTEDSYFQSYPFKVTTFKITSFNS